MARRSDPHRPEAVKTVKRVVTERMVSCPTCHGLRPAGVTTCEVSAR